MAPNIAHRRPGFTLVELLFVMLILSMLIAMAFTAFSGAAEQARESRTKAIIAKLDQLITEKYESYRTRSVRAAASNNQRTNALNRLNALRELMRMELPDRISDVQDDPVVLGNPPGPNARPALSRSYVRRQSASWSATHQGAECLYLIVSSMREGDSNVLEFFAPSEIADTDGDDMPEFLDAWGQPIEFIRWPAGYLAEDPENPGVLANPVASPQIANRTRAPDPFDPVKADSRWSNNTSQVPYLLKPLIYSSGPDKEYGIETYWPTSEVRYSATPAPHRNDPYIEHSSQKVGTPIAGSGFGDNITSHYQEAQ